MNFNRLIFAALIALALAYSAAGCGGTGDDDTGTTLPTATGTPTGTGGSYNKFRVTDIDPQSPSMTDPTFGTTIHWQNWMFGASPTGWKTKYLSKTYFPEITAALKSNGFITFLMYGC